MDPHLVQIEDYNMTHQQYYQLYEDLDSFDVKVTTGENETLDGRPVKLATYAFGPWKVNYALIKNTPRNIIKVDIYNFNLWPVIYAHQQYNSKQPQMNRYKYHIFVAARNKSQKEPWIKQIEFFCRTKKDQSFIIRQPDDKVRGI
jgi:hypothetical protein